jgi:hypothetical protein
MNTTVKSIENTAETFWRVDQILDTRQYDLQTVKPIPGTGDPIPCECCGREINVHAHIYCVSKQTKKVIDRAIVGTQCCKKVKLTNYGQSPSNRDYWKRVYA